MIFCRNKEKIRSCCNNLVAWSVFLLTENLNLSLLGHVINLDPDLHEFNLVMMPLKSPDVVLADH